MWLISADWCGPQRADSPLYGLVNQTHRHTHDRNYMSTSAHETIGAFSFKRTCYEPAYLVGSLDAYALPTAQSFSADSYWACYSPVMNPVARLAWLGFLLHIPGRCQGPHRRQRSLPKSQPCYTDECVCPVLWSRLSAYVRFCLSFCTCFLCMYGPLCPCMCFLPLYLSCFPVRVASNVVMLGNEINVWGEVK